MGINRGPMVELLESGCEGSLVRMVYSLMFLFLL